MNQGGVPKCCLPANLFTANISFTWPKNNWLDSRKFVCHFLCSTTKAEQIILTVPHRFACTLPILINQPGLSCHLDWGFHCGDFPAPALSLLISKWMLRTLPGWHMETVGAWNRVIQISSLPHPCCGAAFAIPQIEQSHRQQSKHTDQLFWLQRAGGSSWLHRLRKDRENFSQWII